eukprot:GILK01000478.1.p1 GENE.GILK01000478.1~~GILK01000478.1.p1  ORF type:complete len:1090 (-),score=288.26 GILK01000478.1:65-3109(-)
MATIGTTSLQESTTAKVESGAEATAGNSPIPVVQDDKAKQLCEEPTADKAIADPSAKAKQEVCIFFKPRVLVAARMVAAVNVKETLFRGDHMSDEEREEVAKICKDRSQGVCYSMARKVHACIASWFRDEKLQESARERKFVECVSKELCDSKYNSYSGEKEVNVPETMKPARAVLEDLANALKALVDTAAANRQADAMKEVVKKLAANFQLSLTIPKLNQEVEAANEKLTQNQETLRQLQEQHLVVENSLKQLEAQKESIQTEKHEAEDKLKKLETEIEQSTGQEQELTNQILATAEKVSECEDDKTKNEQNRAKLQEALDSSQRAITELQAISAAAREDLIALEQTLAQERTAHANKKKQVDAAIAQAQAASAKEKRQINFILPQIELIVKQMDDRAKRLEEVLEIVHCVTPASDGNPSPPSAEGCGPDANDKIAQFKRDANDPDTEVYKIIQGENQDGTTSLKGLVKQSFLQVGEQLTHMESAVRRHLSRRREALKQHTRLAAKSSAREVPEGFADLDRPNTMAWVDGKIVDAADELHNIRAVFATIKEVLDMHSELRQALEKELDEQHQKLTTEEAGHKGALAVIDSNLKGLQSDHEQLNDALSKLREAVTAQENENQMLTQSAQLQQADLLKRKEQLENVRRAVQDAEGLLPRRTAELSGCDEEASKVRGEVEQLLKSVAEAQGEMDRTCAAVHELLEQKTASDLQKDIEKAKNEQAIRNLESASQQEVAQRTQFESLYQELLALQNSLNTDLGLIATAVVDALDAPGAGSNLQTKVAEHREKVKALKQKNADLRATKVVAPTDEFGADFDGAKAQERTQSELASAKEGAQLVANGAREKLDAAARDATTKKTKGSDEPEREAEPVHGATTTSDQTSTSKTANEGKKDSREDAQEDEEEEVEEEEEEATGAKGAKKDAGTTKKKETADDTGEEEEEPESPQPTTTETDNKGKKDEDAAENEEEEEEEVPSSPSASELPDASATPQVKKKDFKIKARKYSGSGPPEARQA